MIFKIEFHRASRNGDPTPYIELTKDCSNGQAAIDWFVETAKENGFSEVDPETSGVLVNPQTGDSMLMSIKH